jgi:ribulose-phosphate 3-epimerase
VIPYIIKKGRAAQQYFYTGKEVPSSMVNIRVAPSLLATIEGKRYSKEELHKALKAAVKATPSASIYHIDVMDAKFVRQETEFLDPDLTAYLRSITEAEIDVHLMAENPMDLIDGFVGAGADYITFHQEAVKDPVKVLEAIRAKGLKGGISINPGTPLSAIEDYLDKLDMVLLMSVIPGECGQKYHSDVTIKAVLLREILKKKGLSVIIEIDGGIKITNSSIPINAAGQNEPGLFLVMGSGVFGNDNPDQIISSIQDPILIGADHGGVHMKEKIKNYLCENAYPYFDVGTFLELSCDHPLIAERVASPIHEGRTSRGILICGTGEGMSIGANRFKGVRATILYDGEVKDVDGKVQRVAELSRAHNDSNLAIFGERSMDHDVIKDLKIWLEHPGPAKDKYKERNKLFDLY